jgi:hypothetical protein
MDVIIMLRELGTSLRANCSAAQSGVTLLRQSKSPVVDSQTDGVGFCFAPQWLLGLPE